MPMSPTATVQVQVQVAPATPQQRVAAIADEVRAMISRGEVDASSAFGILKSAATVGASWDVAESVLVELAKGADGVAGTPDDIIPASTVQAMQAMLRHGVVRDIAAWVATASELSGLVAPLPWYAKLAWRIKTIVTKKKTAAA